jgi:UDP-N-acetylmuramoylalanine--D-glutamate ligase
VYNADDVRVRAMGNGNGHWCFTLGEPLAAVQDVFACERVFGVRQLSDGPWLCRGEQPLMPAADVCMPGLHNRANALAALAMGTALDLDMDSMCEVLRRFPGLPHRTQFVAELGGVRWYNDSKGTNVGATLAAIEGLEGPLVLIAGGDGKGADFTPLAAALRDKGRGCVLMGRDAPRLEMVLADVLPIRHAADMAGAVREAAALALPGDTVLLSPACASTDMFSNYADRGEQFMRAVQEVVG